MIYLLDTNAISDMMVRHANVVQQFKRHDAAGDIIGFCSPVAYELRRGLLWRNATQQLARLENGIFSLLLHYPLTESDWEQAASLWAGTRRRGKQLSEIDLLLAALAQRINAVIVSNDTDFDALVVNREDWRDTP